jgi:hypothetical protein
MHCTGHPKLNYLDHIVAIEVADCVYAAPGQETFDLEKVALQVTAFILTDTVKNLSDKEVFGLVDSQTLEDQEDNEVEPRTKIMYLPNKSLKGAWRRFVGSMEA